LTQPAPSSPEAGAGGPESSAPANQLAGSRLAHAEVNALAQLELDQRQGYQLYVTLEPCLLCWAATSIAGVRTVHFAGADPVWSFLADLTVSHPRLSERAYTREGPMGGPLGAWATLLPLVERLWRDPTGVRIDHFVESAPALVALARRIVADGTARRFVGMSQEEALSLVWDDLIVAVDRDGQRGGIAASETTATG
jgi:hypothetical protein